MKSIFNEDEYLYNDELINNFVSRQEDHYKQIEEDKKNNIEAYYYYDLFLDKVVALLKDIKFNNSLEYSIALSYLIDCGYLSKDFSFIGEESLLEVKTRLGMSIINGSGCCRNISAIAKEVLDKLNYDNSLLYCHEGSHFFKRTKSLPANHVINLINYNNIDYGIDLYNNDILYRFISPLKLKAISSHYSGDLLYKPYYELMRGEADIAEIRNKIDSFVVNNKCLYDIEYEDEIRFYVRDKMKKEEDSLYDFFNENKVLKKEIINRIKPS